MHSYSKLLVLIIACLLGLASPANAISWSLTDFGPATGSGWMATNDLNFNGQMTGSQTTSGGYQAIRVQSGIQQAIGTFGGEYSIGYGINDSGYVTGRASTAGNSTHRAFIWDGSIMYPMATPYSTGYAINDVNQVTGTFAVSESSSHTFIWNGNTVQDLQTLGDRGATGYGISSSGLVTGSTYAQGPNGSLIQHATLWNGSRWLDLGTLGGTRSAGVGVNDSGKATGWSFTPNNDATSRHAFYWDGSAIQDIGTLGGISSGGFDINMHGQVVGTSLTGGNFWHAFVWDAGTSLMTDLNSLIDDPTWVLESARHIDDDGRIIGFGYRGGTYSGFMLRPLDDTIEPPQPEPLTEPVPEPSTMALFVFGLAGVGIFARKGRSPKNG